jgi:type IV secretory pathway TrbD component
MRRRTAILFVIAWFANACASVGHVRREATRPSTAPRAIAVYRAIAESIYVGSTKRVVAVATTSLDSACMTVTCTDLAARWGVETLWWARGDSSEARAARADLLARAAPPFDVRAVAVGQAMLFEADAGDVPPDGASAEEWIRFRAAHADAAGAVRMSPVGFSRSGRTAVTFVDWRCGPTCGHKLGVALIATNDSSWTIAEMLLVSSSQK